MAIGTTVSAMIDSTLDLLLGSAREDINLVAVPVGLTDTTIQVSYPAQSLQQGSFLEIDNELMYVFASTAGSPNATITVRRGMRGTVAATHAAGAEVTSNPYFARYIIQNAIQAEIGSWGPQVYSVRSVLIPLVDYVQGYDLGVLGEYYRIMDVRESPDLQLGFVGDASWPRVKWEELHNAPQSAFPSGKALTIVDPIGIYDSPANQPRYIHVTFAAPFNYQQNFGPNTDLVSQVGLDPNELDIPPYGAAWRLIQGREARRTLIEARGQSQDLTAVPPMYASQASMAFKKVRDDRLGDAAQRLLTQYGVRGK